MKKGYRVQVVSDGLAGYQYLDQNQKTVSEQGYVWRSLSAAENSMKTFMHRLDTTMPGTSIQVVEVDENRPVSPSISAMSTENPKADDLSAISETIPASLPSFEELARTAGAWAEMMSHLEEYKKAYAARLSEEDLRTQDLLHYIELNEINDAEAVDIVRRLKESRLKRREAKDVLHLLELMKDAKPAADTVKRALGRLDRRIYTVRVDENLPEVIARTDEQADHPVNESQEKAESENINEKDKGEEKGHNDLDALAMRVYEDHRKGMNRAALAASYGVSVSTIGRYLKRAQQLEMDQALDLNTDELPF